MHKSVWIEKLPKGYSVRYWADTPNGPRRTREWRSNFAEAQTLKAQIKLKVISKIQGLPDPTRSYADFIAEYLQSLPGINRPVTIKMKAEVLNRINNNIKIHWPIIKADIVAIRQFFQPPRYNQTTLSMSLAIFRTFTMWALRNNYLQINPFIGVSIPPKLERGRKLELDEIQRIWINADARFKPFLGLALQTGARRGEMLKAHWTDFDLDKGIWTIPAENCKTKTARTVPLPLAICEMLRPLNNGNAVVFHDFTRDTPGWYLEKACKKAGLTSIPRVHDLRHTFASHWQGRTIPLMDMLGWKSIFMLKRYTHLNVEDIRQEAQSKGLILNLA